MASIADARGQARSVVVWASASAALAEGYESGDLHLVVEFPDGALVAVIDGLGHGPEAAFAAREAAQLLAASPRESVSTLVQRCHQGLRRTRGVVMSLASFDVRDDSMTWIGVGNVESVLLRANPGVDSPREAMVGRGGVVGYQLPPLRAATLSVSPGDTLIMATDGLRTEFASGVNAGRDTKETADAIMALHRKRTDDALVLVVRYRGSLL